MARLLTHKWKELLLQNEKQLSHERLYPWLVYRVRAYYHSICCRLAFVDAKPPPLRSGANKYGRASDDSAVNLRWPAEDDAIWLFAMNFIHLLKKKGKLKKHCAAATGGTMDQALTVGTQHVLISLRFFFSGFFRSCAGPNAARPRSCSLLLSSSLLAFSQSQAPHSPTSMHALSILYSSHSRHAQCLSTNPCRSHCRFLSSLCIHLRVISAHIIVYTSQISCRYSRALQH